LRDVPDLVGPGEDLCAECYGVAAEVMMPSLLKGWEEAEEDLERDLYEVIDEKIAGFFATGDALLADLAEEEERNDASLFGDLMADFDHGEGLPTFHGKPRF
jgi:hypothetical protein